MSRVFIFVIALLIFNSCATQKKVVIKELDYGLSTATIVSSQTMDNSPSGKYNATSPKLKIVKRTDTIEAKIGVQFGVEYRLESNSNQTIPLKISWKYPKGMKDVNGKEITETTYILNKRTNEYTYSNFTLEGANEVVPGEWTLELSNKNKKIYQKTFYLVNDSKQQ